MFVGFCFGNGGVKGWCICFCWVGFVYSRFDL